MRKIISILMILILLVSSIPAYATGNNDTLPSNPSAGKGSAFWNIPAYNDMGMRLTIYWGKNEDAFNAGDIVKIGKTFDFAKQGSGARYQIEQYTTMSVYDYMRTKVLNSKIFEKETNIKNYKYVIDNTMPDVRRTVADFKNAKSEWDKWILSPDSTGTYTFTNLSLITSKLGHNIEPNDLKNGYYNDGKGGREKGLYKIYIEPVSYSFIDGIYSAMTMRDLISWQYSYDKGYIKTDKIKSNSTGEYYNPSIITALTPLFDTTGNSQYLLYDVNALNLKGNTPVYQIDGSTTSDARNEIKKQIQPGGKIYNSMGVGEYELPVKTINDIPLVYRTYSVVDDVKDGKIIYKHVVTKELIPELSLGGGYTPPDLSYIYFPDGETHIRGVAVLNDMVISKLLMDSSSLVWNSLPKSNIGEITAKDIDYYALSLAEGVGVDIDLYTNYFKKYDKENYNKLTTFHKDLTLAMQEDAVKSTFETKQKINSLYFQIYMLVGGSYARSGIISTSSTIDDLIKSRFGDILSKPKQLTSITEIPLKKGDDYYIAYEHYIILPSSSQVNIIETRQEGSNKLIKSRIEIEPIQISGAQVEMQIAPKVGLALEEYKVSTSKDLSKMPTNGIKQQGTKIEDTVTVSLVDNLFVRWVEYVPYSASAGITDAVPEWRLSKYVPASNWQKTTMSLGNLTQDDPIAVSLGYTGYLTPTNLSYAPINANGKQGVDTRYNDWLYSKTFTQGSYSLSRNNPSSDIDVRADKHLIKSTSGFGLNLANWVGNNSISGISDILASNKGISYKGSEIIEKSASLNLKTLNTNDFNNYYSTTYDVIVTRTGIRYTRNSNGVLLSTPYTYTDTETRGRVSGPQTITPNQAIYTPAVDAVAVTFERFKSEIIDKKVKITQKSNVDNGLTSITLDTKKSLSVYPEVAMMYQDNAGANSIRFVAGDIARTVPVASYHTMDYNVFVTPKVTTPTATIDSRARQLATKIGLTGLQPMILKGGMVTSNFDIKKSKSTNEKGELVIKSYTIDLADSVKSAWGSTVNINQIHTDYLTKWDFNNASGFSKLEIANANNNGATYTGPEVYSSKKIGNIKYTKSTDTSKTYALTVRGGVVTAVDNTPINTIKSNNPELYKAIEGLQLIGSGSVLSNFAHKEGKALTEQEFKTKAAAVKGVDNLTLNEGWYSEDSTVLVIKEISTTYKIDNYFSTDAIPLAVKGLETPINKGEFYSKGFRGHTILNYSLLSRDFGSGIGTIKAYFEHNSRTGSDYGDKTTEYGVPNVSIQDGTGW